jgi:hypothetical protein
LEHLDKGFEIPRQQNIYQIQRKMNEFWINNGWYFILVGILTLCLFIFTLHYYTGSVKKLDLIIKDIRTLGSPGKEVLSFDKFYNPQGLDHLRLSIFTHLFYSIPKKNNEPLLYNNNYFLKQLSTVSIYRSIYKIVSCLIILDIVFIITMTIQFGQNIK